VRWSGQSRAIQRFGAVNRKLRSPVASAARDLPLREPVRSAILPQNQPQSGECRFKIIEELVQWENTTNEEVLERARAEIWQSWRTCCAD
jgi:hypothetical protein